jgi:DNA-binding response OmpR family regulator
LEYTTHAATRTFSNAETRTIVLTAKEFQLLEYLMQHPNQILTRDQILNQLWEIGEEPISNVVAAQVRLLRRKLGDDNSRPLIENIYGVGYRLNSSS